MKAMMRARAARFHVATVDDARQRLACKGSWHRSTASPHVSFRYPQTPPPPSTLRPSRFYPYPIAFLSYTAAQPVKGPSLSCPCTSVALRLDDDRVASFQKAPKRPQFSRPRIKMEPLSWPPSLCLPAICFSPEKAANPLGPYEQRTYANTHDSCHARVAVDDQQRSCSRGIATSSG